MCRPELVEDGEPILELEEMRHPCVSSTCVRVCGGLGFVWFRVLMLSNTAQAYDGLHPQ